MLKSIFSLNIFRRLRTGSESAAREFDDLYRSRLCRLVELEMDRRFRPREDPEDVVQSVLATVVRRARKGEFVINHSGQLWGLLVKVTRHRILKHAEYHNAGKRNPTRERRDGSGDSPASQPTSADAVLAVDLMENVLEGLDSSYAEILQLLLEGLSERETARKLGCTRLAVHSKRVRLAKRLEKLIEEPKAWITRPKPGRIRLYG